MIPEQYMAQALRAFFKWLFRRKESQQDPSTPETER